MPATWTIANLTTDQQTMLEEAEESLGADYLLAYAPPDDVPAQAVPPVPGLHVAELDDRQVECLQGLESKLKAVVVAYEE